ncbi:hypothetical protein AB9F39_36875, partial [Rhizobium leguminosarum]|uniref:hypothetical protein n=1 Tax=Rhizobium leguminosarum TaxID=384 RepID=UPI003F989183
SSDGRKASASASSTNDASGTLELQRRDALWAIKALRDEPLPLFVAAAEREMRTIAEKQEPDVELRQITDGHNVIQDYSHTGLTLRE